jgi:hypothetical protein
MRSITNSGSAVASRAIGRPTQIKRRRRSNRDDEIVVAGSKIGNYMAGLFGRKIFVTSVEKRRKQRPCYAGETGVG